MRVLLWLLLWASLLVGSGWYLRGRVRAAWRRADDLGRELDHAQTRMQAAQTAAHGAAQRDAAQRDASADEPVELAVFAGVARAYRERVAVRGALDEHRRARRALRRPGWARRVDS